VSRPDSVAESPLSPAVSIDVSKAVSALAVSVGFESDPAVQAARRARTAETGTTLREVFMAWSR
jgi:hypothetical protein